MLDSCILGHNYCHKTFVFILCVFLDDAGKIRRDYIFMKQGYEPPKLKIEPRVSLTPKNQHFPPGADFCNPGVGEDAPRLACLLSRSYGQVLAYSVGLGDWLKHPERLDMHLAHVRSANRLHNDVLSGELRQGCLNGLVIYTGRSDF